MGEYRNYSQFALRLVFDWFEDKALEWSAGALYRRNIEYAFAKEKPRHLPSLP